MLNCVNVLPVTLKTHWSCEVNTNTPPSEPSFSHLRVFQHEARRTDVSRQTTEMMLLFVKWVPHCKTYVLLAKTRHQEALWPLWSWLGEMNLLLLPQTTRWETVRRVDMNWSTCLCCSVLTLLPRRLVERGEIRELVICPSILFQLDWLSCWLIPWSVSEGTSTKSGTVQWEVLQKCYIYLSPDLPINSLWLTLLSVQRRRYIERRRLAYSLALAGCSCRFWSFMARPMFPVIFSLPWKNACESERRKRRHPRGSESEENKRGLVGVGENYMLLVLRVTVRD